MHKDNKDFDLKVRETLAGASVDKVPEGLWEGVRARMGAVAATSAGSRSGRHASYPLLLLAAAAAVALLLILTGTFRSKDTVSPSEYISEVQSPKAVSEVDSEPRTAEVPAPVALPERIRQTAGDAPCEKEIPAREVETSLIKAEKADEPLVAEAAPDAAEAETCVEEAIRETSVIAEALPFDESAKFPGQNETKHSRRRIAVTISGLSQENGISSSAPGQEFGPSSGGGIRPSGVRTASPLAGVSESDVTTYLMPLSAGIGVNFPISGFIGIGTGLTYTYLHSNFSGSYTRVSGDMVDVFESDDIDHNIHYLGVPLNVYFTIFGTDQKVRMYGYAGGMVERAFSNKYFIHCGGTTYTHSGKIEGVQLSVAAGFGLEYRLTDFLGLYLDPSIRYYFDCDQPKSVRTQQPWTMCVELGLRFTL